MSFVNRYVCSDNIRLSINSFATSLSYILFEVKQVNTSFKAFPTMSLMSSIRLGNLVVSIIKHLSTLQRSFQQAD